MNGAKQSFAIRISNHVAAWVFGLMLFAMLTGLADPFTSALLLELSIDDDDWLTKLGLWIAGPVNIADELRRYDLLAFTVFSIVISFLISMTCSVVAYGCAKLNEIAERQAAASKSDKI